MTRTLAALALLLLGVASDSITSYYWPGCSNFGDMCVITVDTPMDLVPIESESACVGHPTRDYPVCDKKNPMRANSPLQEAEGMRT